MKKISLFFIALFFLSACTPKTVEDTEFLLDTIVSIRIYDGNAKSQKLIQESFARCRQAENLLSKTIASSDIGLLNANKQSLSLHPYTLRLIQTSLYYSQLTQGAFDITVEPLMALWDFAAEQPVKPTDEEIRQTLERVGYHNIALEAGQVTLRHEASVDLGGIAKGAIADDLKEFLVEQGVTSAIIDLGGNIVTIGRKTDGSLFTVGIQKPFDESGSLLATVQVEDKTVVTSGIYERYFQQEGTVYHHILDPKTGYPVDNDLYAVTIVADISMDADALSTSCLVLGREKGMALLETLEGVEGVFVTKDYDIYKTSGMGVTVPFEILE